MKRFMLMTLAGLAALALSGAASSATASKTICVGNKVGCYAALQAGLNAASNGDTLKIMPGSYAGGVTVDKSVALVGSGSGVTTISGGGPVLTIGTYNASSEPTVSISGVTITGGESHTDEFGDDFRGSGGGISVPPSVNFGEGATLLVANSVITGNTATPTTAIDSGLPCPQDVTITCIDGDLPFAGADGAGISTFGPTTLTNTIVSHNRAGGTGVESDAGGGGISSVEGGLTLEDSTITDNQASVMAPNGRFADSGGVDVGSGRLTVDSSQITDNTASESVSMPSDIPGGTLAVAGGLHSEGGVSAATITNTTISGNSVSATNTVGDAEAFSGGLHTDGTFKLSADVVSNNSVISATIDGSTGNAGGDSGAGEWAGTVTNTRVSGNSVSASSVAGNAEADAGATIFQGPMTNSEISNNHVQASSANGSAIDQGAGLVIGDVTTLRNTTLSGNTANATGLSGFARGGGIYNVDQSPNGPSGGPLKLINSSVTGNELSGSAAIGLLGGGIYTTNPVFLTNSLITANAPDQCYGC
jgi:hypothetical protein